MKYFLLTVLLFPFCGAAQTYSRNDLTSWLQEGAWDKIIAVAQQAAPSDTFLLQSAGYAAYQSGDKEQASAFFNRVLVMDSNNRPALYYTGLMLKSDEQCAAAIPIFRRLCNVAPTVSQYQVLLADCYSAKDELTAALRHLKTAYTLTPVSPAIANKLANVWMRLKKWDSASAVLVQARKEHPRDPALIGTGIALAYNTRKYDQVSRLADSLIMTGKLKQESLLTALYADVISKNHTHALRIGHLLLELGSESEDVLYYTAFAHQQLKDWQAADTLLRKCISKLVKPNLEAYYVAQAEGAAKMKDWKRSAALYDTAYYLFRNPQTLYLKGLMLEEMGRKTEAKQVFRKYLALPESKQDTAIAHYLQKAVQQ